MRSLLPAAAFILLTLPLLTRYVAAADFKLCPAQREASSVAVGSASAGSTAPPSRQEARDNDRGRAEAASDTPRLRPRWQSFLPGMMR